MSWRIFHSLNETADHSKHNEVAHGKHKQAGHITCKELRSSTDDVKEMDKRKRKEVGQATYQQFEYPSVILFMSRKLKEGTLGHPTLVPGSKFVVWYGWE